MDVKGQLKLTKTVILILDKRKKKLGIFTNSTKTGKRVTQADISCPFSYFSLPLSSPDGEIMNLTQAQLQPQASNPLRVKTNMAPLW